MRSIRSTAATASLAILLSLPAHAGDLVVPPEAAGFSDLSDTKGTLIQIPGVKSMKPTRIAPPPEPSAAALASTARSGDPAFKPGDVLPNQYMMLFDVSRYDLPRPKDGWVYFTVGTDIYRANLNSRTVLERMAQQVE